MSPPEKIDFVTLFDKVKLEIDANAINVRTGAPTPDAGAAMRFASALVRSGGLGAHEQWRKPRGSRLPRELLVCCDLEYVLAIAFAAGVRWGRL